MKLLHSEPHCSFNLKREKTMSHTAKELLDRFSEKPGTLCLKEFFEDNNSGCGCRAFYVLHGSKKRRLLIRVTEEYVEDELKTESAMEKAVTLIEAHIASVQERIKTQSRNFEREPDYVLSNSALGSR